MLWANKGAVHKIHDRSIAYSVLASLLFYGVPEVSFFLALQAVYRRLHETASVIGRFLFGKDICYCAFSFPVNLDQACCSSNPCRLSTSLSESLWELISENHKFCIPLVSCSSESQRESLHIPARYSLKYPHLSCHNIATRRFLLNLIHFRVSSPQIDFVRAKQKEIKHNSGDVLKARAENQPSLLGWDSDLLFAEIKFVSNSTRGITEVNHPDRRGTDVNPLVSVPCYAVIVSFFPSLLPWVYTATSLPLLWMLL